MISVIIPAKDEAVELAVTLAALVPAAVDGQVREVVLFGPAFSEAVLDLADDAGTRLETRAFKTKSDWLLILRPDAKLPAGWREAAARHVQKSPWQAGWLAGDGLLEKLLPLPRPEQGLLVPKALVEALSPEDYGDDLEARLKGRLKPIR